MRRIPPQFPLYAGLLALLFYLGTLSHGATLASVSLTAKLGGWDDAPLTDHPLFWLLTLPLQGLPAAWLPTGLNLFAAVCAALALGLLAASVPLLPWHRRLDTLPAWQTHLPVGLALAACGMQFDFWQAATRATGESLQILLLAAAVWSLLQHRATRLPGWIKLSVFCWGLGMVENWMMFVTSPIFLVIVVFFIIRQDLDFGELPKLLLAGAAGLALYALLPVVNGLSPHSGMSFWEAWRDTLRATKHLIGYAYFGLWKTQWIMAVASVIFYLVALAPQLWQQADNVTFQKGRLDALEAWGYRGLQLILLVFGLWLAFDPVFGLRDLLRNREGLNLPLLSLDYLLALGISRCAGNLLLALDLETRVTHPEHKNIRNLARAGTPVLVILLAVTAGGLVVRNAPAILSVNRLPLARFGEQVLTGLPTSQGVVLSDDLLKLFSFRAAADASGSQNHWQCVVPEKLAQPAYRHRLARRWDAPWLAGATGTVTPDDVAGWFATLRQSNQLYYLHSPWGAWLERLYPVPAGLAQQLFEYADRSVNPPGLTPEQVDREEQYWNTLKPWLASLQEDARAGIRTKPRAGHEAETWLRLPPVARPQSELLCSWYAAALDAWGVTLQQHGRLAAAGQWFAAAMALDEANLSARINYQFNSLLLQGRATGMDDSGSFPAELNQPERLIRQELACGPVDEPTFCYAAGNLLAARREARQALQQFQRASLLATNTATPGLALADQYLKTGFTALALQTLGHLRETLPASLLQTNKAVHLRLALLEASAWVQMTNWARADAVLAQLQQDFAGDNPMMEQILEGSLANGDLVRAQSLVESLLTARPDDSDLLLNKAWILACQNEFALARQTLEKVVHPTDPLSVTLLQGNLCQKLGQWEQSIALFQQLEATPRFTVAAHLGEAEAFLHRQDTNQAVAQLKLALSATTANSSQQQLIAARLEELTTSRATK